MTRKDWVYIIAIVLFVIIWLFPVILSFSLWNFWYIFLYIVWWLPASILSGIISVIVEYV